ncbi:MAG: GNAT family N-acetyltransferase [Candidatus Faecivivens sp.]|nr:GNAT family N-acetyltransferase [Candidatus Faecivivens sp.]
MKLICKHFNDLTAKELYEILRLRVDVFVVEQKCSYSEVDGKDLDAWHLWFEDEDGIAGYLRLLAPGVSFKEASIGRVIAKKRRCGIGSKLMQAGIEKMKEIYGDTDIRIEAQVYAREFYEKAGFVKVSEEFLDDGIPHIEMLRKG